MNKQSVLTSLCEFGEGIIVFIKGNTVIGFSGQLMSWAHCFKVRKIKDD